MKAPTVRRRRKGAPSFSKDIPLTSLGPQKGFRSSPRARIRNGVPADYALNKSTLANCELMSGNGSRAAAMGGTALGDVGWAPRWIFVRGLHHSGTTLVANLLALSPQVSAIRTGHHQDEGQHVQLQPPGLSAIV